MSNQHSDNKTAYIVDPLEQQKLSSLDLHGKIDLDFKIEETKEEKKDA